MNKQFYIFQNMQMKNLIIFLVVSAFAAQALLLIIIYGHDIPLSDDADQIFLGYLIANNYEITTNDFIDIHNGNIPLFIRLLSVPLLLTFSFTSMPIFYLQWIFLCIIITVTYYLLKRTNEKATWLIIPISMLVFNQLQEYPLTWTLGGLQQTLPLLSYVLIIFLLNTSKLTFPKISLALFFASVAMFSNEAGLFFWPIMILSFLRQKKRKKWVITWILGCSFLTLLFLSQTIGSDCKFGGGCEENIIVNSFTDLIDNEKIYAFFLSLGSIAFRLKFNEMYIIVGTIIIISFLMGLFFSLFNR